MPLPPSMSRLVKALVLGSVIAAAGLLASLLPLALYLEEEWGLDLLFRLRGARQPPPDVVIVSIDGRSAAPLGLPSDPAKWPRLVHARLTETLVERGAAVVAFDIVFDQPRVPEEDERFANAIARAGNVVLGQYLTRETVPLAAGAGSTGQAIAERLLPLHPAFADTALAVAPFPLPKIPVKVSQYWTFKTGAGDVPTLPVVAFQIFALDLYDAFIRLFEEVSPYLAERLPSDRRAIMAGRHADQVIRLLREIFQHDPRAADRMLERLRTFPPPGLDIRARRRLAALVDMYRAPASEYLNFYGPPGTIPTVPPHEILLSDRGAPSTRLDLRGKAVFVGLSESIRPNQKDGFYTVFSEPSGADLSGVEIAATAFANLLEALPVRPLELPWHLGTLLAWGLAVGAVCRLVPALGAASLLLAGGALYVAAVQHQFRATAVWFPLVVPLLFQAPLAFLCGILSSYFAAQTERENIRRVLGYYLPARVADQLARRVASVGASDLVYGICLSTDAHQYTTLAEAMDPQELGALMNRYYAAIFDPVKRHGGMVSDVVGDSMLAIWAGAHPDRSLRRQACLASLDIADAVDRFNQGSGSVRLPTRIGLHSGQMLLGNVGAIDHYEYRAIGDIVNTATRLEGLNKHLGTRIAVTEDVLREVEGVLGRELGAFVLAGKSKPVVVYELLSRTSDASPQEVRLCAAFADALAGFRAQSWKEASDSLQECLLLRPDDGPSLFYARLCRQYAEMPLQEAWDAVLRMDSK